MIKLNYNNLTVNSGDVIELKQLDFTPTVSWDFLPGHLYTLILYDEDAPEQAPDNFQSPLVLWLIVNIPQDHVQNGDILLDYVIPIINITNHYLTLAVYHQMDEIADRRQSRVNFPLQQFIRQNNLQKLNSIEFYVDNDIGKNKSTNNSNFIQNYSSTGTNGYTGKIVSRPSYPYQQADMLRQNYFDNDKLTINQQKYCRCVASVQSSADWSCQEQIWGKANCANPKQQCQDLLANDSQPSCASSVDFFAMPDEDLVAYAQLENIDVPYPYDRSQMIANLIDGIEED